MIYSHSSRDTRCRSEECEGRILIRTGRHTSSEGLPHLTRSTVQSSEISSRGGPTEHHRIRDGTISRVVLEITDTEYLSDRPADRPWSCRYPWEFCRIWEEIHDQGIRSDERNTDKSDDQGEFSHRMIL